MGVRFDDEFLICKHETDPPPIVANVLYLEYLPRPRYSGHGHHLAGHLQHSDVTTMNIISMTDALWQLALFASKY